MIIVMMAIYYLEMKFILLFLITFYLNEWVRILTDLFNSSNIHYTKLLNIIRHNS